MFGEDFSSFENLLSGHEHSSRIVLRPLDQLPVAIYDEFSDQRGRRGPPLAQNLQRLFKTG